MANSTAPPTGASPPTPSASPAPRRRPARGKRSRDGMLKVGIWWKVHRLDSMFYFYSDKKGDYDKELAQLMSRVDKMRDKIDSARIYEVGDGTRGPEIFAYKDGEWYTPKPKHIQ